jgi:hypothetical protein
MHIAAQAVELGDRNRAFATPGLGKRGGKLRPPFQGIRTLPSFDLYEFAADLEALSGGKAGNSFALRIEP